MKRDWLIRTKNNHILGPVSKHKIRELIENGSIKGDDELCQANGHWFQIRENDYIDRFVYGEERMPPNPISEAPILFALREDGDLPSEHGASSVENTAFLQLDQVKSGAQDKENILEEREESSNEQAASVEDKAPKSSKAKASSSTRKSFFSANDKILFLIAIISLLVAVMTYVKKKQLFESAMEISWVITPSTHAQSVSSDLIEESQKKNVLLLGA